MNILQRFKFKLLQRELYKVHRLYEREGGTRYFKPLSRSFYAMANFYEKHRFDKNLPFAAYYALECYRVLASHGDAKAQYLLGKRLLDLARFWEKLAKNPLYKANRPKEYAPYFFEEALIYLQAADEQGYPLARRLLGMANIHGWGVPTNIERGYQLVLESIDLEKAWGKATQIFDTLKLNSPEFFAALRAYKG